jgi:hypothetical protein
VKLSMLLLAVVCLFVTLPSQANASTSEVIAFNAPDCTGTSNPKCASFLQNVLPYISGIGLVVPWSAIDCSASTTMVFTPCYTWSTINTKLNAYINTNSNYPTFTWASGCFGGRHARSSFSFSPK